MPRKTAAHADAVFLGEAEGRMEEVCEDFRKGKLKKVYNYLEDRPPIESVGPARRDILKKNLYNYRGIQMVDLLHASRGCRYDCYPCAVAYLGGRKFRPRTIEKSIAEMAGIDNNRLFIVDYSLAQDTHQLDPYPNRRIQHLITRTFDQRHTADGEGQERLWVHGLQPCDLD